MYIVKLLWICVSEIWLLNSSNSVNDNSKIELPPKNKQKKKTEGLVVVFFFFFKENTNHGEKKERKKSRVHKDPFICIADIVVGLYGGWLLHFFLPTSLLESANRGLPLFEQVRSVTSSPLLLLNAQWSVITSPVHHSHRKQQQELHFWQTTILPPLGGRGYYRISSLVKN